MYLLSLPSGLTGLLTDAREFFAAMRFAHPGALWLLLLLPVLGLLNRWAMSRRRQSVANIGRPAAVAGQLTHPRPKRRWLGLAYPIAWILLVIGIAGPRWGKSDETGVAVGRDIVVVIDLSRTMRAADMSDPTAHTRWEAARAGALNLLDVIARRGGHRVAVVAFAARPKVICPLTTDYDHVRAVLEDIDGEFPPAELRPGADLTITSGTRIGAALIAAVEAHDPRFPGSQDIILISDGDDPGGDDEWRQGTAAARAADIPVHTVGVGSFQSTPVEINMELLCYTKLQESFLKDLAKETRGHYEPARVNVPELGDFFRTRIEPNPSRMVSDDQIPQPKEQYVWFLAPALGFFLVGWLRGR